MPFDDYAFLSSPDSDQAFPPDEVSEADQPPQTVRGADALIALLDQEQRRSSCVDTSHNSGRQPETVRRFQLRTINEVKNTPVQLDLVRGLLPAGPSIVLVYGESSVGKSFWTSSLVLGVARGDRWNGRRTRQTGVVYISSEGRMGLRIQAYEKVHSVNLDALPFRLIETGLDLSQASKRDVDLLIEAVAELGITIGVLVIDTLARNFGGGDPDKSGDMSTFVEACGRFARAFDAVVIAIHHPGKDNTKGPRNSYALTAGVDTQIFIKAVGDMRQVEVQKQRDGKAETAESFRLEVIDLGPHPDPDADADERLTSCVAVPFLDDGASSVSAGRRVRLANDAQVALDALAEVIGTQGERLPSSSSIPVGVNAVRIPHWRRQFELRIGGDVGDAGRSREALRKAFGRAKQQLLKAGCIQISDPMVWLC
jgi:hypothetical protein